MKKNISSRKIIFIALFVVVGLLALQVPFTNIWGSSIKFTLFDFFGPIAGGFLGAVTGTISVLVMEIINFLIHGANPETAVIIRFFPMLLATIYFAGKSKKLMWAIPVIAMIMFWAHPEGRQVWYYALYWLIPIVMLFLKQKSLLARSLGTTFTAHCVGSVAWLYAFDLPATVWQGLIPVVAMERALFALGIAATYLVFNNVLDYLAQKQVIPHISINPKYLIRSYVKSK